MQKQHKIKTPIKARYSRTYTRLQNQKATKEEVHELVKKGLKIEMVKEKGKLVKKVVKALKPYRKEVA